MSQKTREKTFSTGQGITGGIRGAIFKHPLTGELLRPDLFIADDIQTDKVADSPSQIAKITRYLESAVQGLAGPGEVISGLMPCTVIQEGDVSDTFLDRQLKPRWKGERCAMVINWPAGISDTGGRKGKWGLMRPSGCAALPGYRVRNRVHEWRKRG